MASLIFHAAPADKAGLRKALEELANEHRCELHIGPPLEAGRKLWLCGPAEALLEIQKKLHDQKLPEGCFLEQDWVDEEGRVRQ